MDLPAANGDSTTCGFEQVGEYPTEPVAGPRLYAAVAFGITVLLTAGFLTTSIVPGWAPRMGGLFVAYPLGVLCLARLLKHRDVQTIVLSAAVGWSAFIAVFQTAPGIGLFGMLGLESSVLIYLGSAACWALGRFLDEGGRRLLPWVLIGGLSLNASFGILQIVLQVDHGALVLDDGRAAGLATYSIYFGSLMTCGGMVLAALELDRKWFWHRLIGVFALAVASGLSGSRAAFGAAIVVALWVAYRRRDITGAALLPVVLVANYVASWLSSYFVTRAASTPTSTSTPSPNANAGSPGGSALDRLGGNEDFVGGGLSWRVDAWRAGLDAWTERPITGWGVGNFRQAVQATVGQGFEQSAPRFDAHNIFVELLATVGLPGLLLFGAFGVLCARNARGPLALGAAALALSWLLQPAGISTLPLALLMLGASSPLPETAGRPDADATRPTRTYELAAALGLVIAMGFLAVDTRLSRAVDRVDPIELESLAQFYPFDPTVADLVAQAWTIEAAVQFLDPNTPQTQHDFVEERVLWWSRQAINRQRDAPRWLDALALRQIKYADYDDAKATLNAALELQPQRRETLQLLSQLENLTEAAASDQERGSTG